jgi:hypothetical protein
LKNLLLFLLAALSLAYPCELLANPIYMPEEPSNLQFVSIPILLVSEGVILAWFSELSLPNLIRFTGVWTLVTSSTFVLLMLAISKVTDVANFSQMSFSDARATETYAGECIFVGEIVITLIESAVLYFLLRLPKITGKEGYALVVFC